MGCRIIPTPKNLNLSPLLGIVIFQTFLGCSLVIISLIYLLDLIQNFPMDRNELNESATHYINTFSPVNDTDNSTSHVNRNESDINSDYKSWFVCSSLCVLLGLVQFLYNFQSALHPQKLESKWIVWCGFHGLLSLLILILFSVGLSDHGITSEHLPQSTQCKAIGYFSIVALNFICTFISISYMYFTIGITALRKTMNQIFGVKPSII